jgi:ammonia channel protein AmtB
MAVNAILSTQIATSCAAFSWILMEYCIKRQPTVLGMINGALAGLISITPAAGYVDATGAFFIGKFIYMYICMLTCITTYVFAYVETDMYIYVYIFVYICP